MPKELIWYKNIATGVAMVMLLLALAPWPYGYFMLLRWVVAITAGLLVYTAHQTEGNAWVVVGVIVLILYNPIAPVHLSRDIWPILDVVTAFVFGAAFFIGKSVRIKNEQ